MYEEKQQTQWTHNNGTTIHEGHLPFNESTVYHGPWGCGYFRGWQRINCELTGNMTCGVSILQVTLKVKESLLADILFKSCRILPWPILLLRGLSAAPELMPAVVVLLCGKAICCFATLFLTWGGYWVANRGLSQTDLFCAGSMGKKAKHFGFQVVGDGGYWVYREEGRSRSRSRNLLDQI